MKQWNKISGFATKPRYMPKTENDLWCWRQKQAALKEKDAAIASRPSDNPTTLALMVWSDDGGTVR